MSIENLRRRLRPLGCLLTLFLMIMYTLALGSPPTPLPSALVRRTLILQPDGAVGADTFILNTTRDWNFGNNLSLLVGRDSANASLARSLLRFDMSGLPANAQVVNASLELYQNQGGGGIIHARRAYAPWTEGSGQRSWTRVPVTVRETAGVRRVLEPVGLTLPFQPYGIQDPQRDLQVLAGSSSNPSQIYQYTYTGGQLSAARVYFEVSVGPLQTRYFNITYGANGTAIPAYRLRTWNSVTPLWTYGPTGTGQSAPSVVDLDGDGRLDIVFGGADGFVYALNETGKLKWRTLVSATGAVPYTPQVRDMDNDGRMDIVVLATPSTVVRLNSTGTINWTANLGGGNALYSTPTLLDVNGDGVLDVLMGGKMTQVDALSGVNGAVIATYPVGKVGTYTSSILDIDRDGLGEFLFASDDNFVHAYNRAGTQIWAGPAGASTFIENSVAIGDVNNDGIPDVVTGDDSLGGNEFALRSSDGVLLWSVAIPNYREGGQTLADIDQDGIPDAITGLLSGQLYALRGTDGFTIWSYVTGGTTLALAPSYVDLDKDGTPELLYMEKGTAAPNTTVRVLNLAGSLVHSWTIGANDPGVKTLSQKIQASPVVADVDGDGTMEVLVPTSNGLQAYATGGLARDWRTWGYNWNHTHRAYDGNSPDGAPLLVASMGPRQVYPGAGASWNYTNGSAPWGTLGGDFGIPEANASSVVGWMAWNVTNMVKDWHNPLGFPNVGLFLTEANEATGTLHSFVSSDAATPALRPRLTIQYMVPGPDLTPRIVGTIADQVKAEDSPPWTLSLASYAFDNDTPLSQLRWNITGFDPAKIRIDGLNTLGEHNLTFRAIPNAWGSMAVTYWLTDPQGNTARQTAWINLTPANDPPTFNPPSSLIVHYNSTYTFDFLPYISDVDTPLANLTLSSNDPRASVSGFNVSFLYPKSLLNQWVFVTLTVRDGQASVSRIIPVKVTSDNPPRLTKKLPNLSMFEGQFLQNVFDLDDYFTDPDRDSLFFSFGYTHLNITIHPDHTVDVRAQAEWWGQERVTFRATDPTGAIAEDSIIVTVYAVNDPPVWGPVPDLRVRYDANYSFNLDPYISDNDTPTDQLVVTASSPYITVSGHLITLLFPSALNNTVQNVTLTLSDGVSSVLQVVRVAVGSDWPPELRVKLGDRRFNEDTVLKGAYNLSVAFRDPEGSRLYYTSGNKSVLIAISAWGSVDLSALPNWFGTERVTFRATDPLGALAEDVVWITVDPVDDAPFFKPVPAQFLNSSTAFLDLAPYLGDVDNNVSDLKLSTTNGNATVIGQGILLNYANDATDSVEVVVSDDTLSNSTRIDVRVVLPAVPTALPTYLYWLPLPVGAAASTAFLLYRRRRVDWAYLATNSGLVVASMFRRGGSSLDTDQVAGLMTAIQDFATETFSDEKRRRLEGLSLGDRRVALERGQYSYLAVVYLGHTPGLLPRHMRDFLREVEARHGQRLKDFMDTSGLGDVPLMLQRLIERSWWPFLSFDDAGLLGRLLHRTKVAVGDSPPPTPPTLPPGGSQTPPP